MIVTSAAVQPLRGSVASGVDYRRLRLRLFTFLPCGDGGYLAGQPQTEHASLPQKPEALTEWVAGLRKVSDGVSRGPQDGLGADQNSGLGDFLFPGGYDQIPYALAQNLDVRLGGSGGNDQ